MQCTGCQHHNTGIGQRLCGTCGVALPSEPGFFRLSQPSFAPAGATASSDRPTARATSMPTLVTEPVSAAVMADTTTLLLRGAYFMVIGWWLAGLWTIGAWFANLPGLGAPGELRLTGRLPRVLFLEDRGPATLPNSDAGARTSNATGLTQRPFALRAIWFALIGWWISLVWMIVAWLLCLTIVGMPTANAMFGCVPALMTRARM